MQHNINLSVPRQGDRNELLAKVAKRAERAQLLVYYDIDNHTSTCTMRKYTLHGMQKVHTKLKGACLGSSTLLASLGSSTLLAS